MSAKLKYEIDYDICAGHGRCYVLAPESFTADDIGYGQVVDRTYSEEDREVMEGLVISCPEGAILIKEAE